MSANKLFRIVDGPVKIRPLPNRTSTALKEQLQIGHQIEVKSDSRTVADGYVWWQHQKGWSAERSEDGTTILMQEVVAETAPAVGTGIAAPAGTTNAVPSIGTVAAAPAPVAPAPTAAPALIGPVESDAVTLPTGETLRCPVLFQQLPVKIEDTDWFQYFGNSKFAFDLCNKPDPGMQRMYFYCQGLHGGIDFGNSKRAVPILAGVNGVVEKVELNARSYGPNFVRVKIGDWTIIYGHMGNVSPLAAGQAVTPDMRMGEVESTQDHLHLEVRYKNTWIINPLLFMPVEMRNVITGKFGPFTKYFYSESGWSQWVTPYDQPVLKSSAPDKAVILGPRAGR